jgi:uncharacterized membrane-anchored protein YitT (DUF2179 family)
MNFTDILSKRNLKHLTLVILGCLISSIAINMFIVPAHLFSIGVSGIAILIQYVTKFPTGYTIILLNIPLIVLSFKKLNWRFTFNSTIGIICYSYFLVVTKNIQNILGINDVLILSVFGGVLNGLGIGLAFAHHGSTGGVHFITLMLKKKYSNYNVGALGFVCNLLVVVLGTILNGFTLAFYTIISMYVTSVVTDKIINGLQKKKVLFIVSDKEQQIHEYIKSQTLRGATAICGQGLNTEKNRQVVYCIVHASHLPEFKYGLQLIDKDALISIIDASEVSGRGYDMSIL